ncbi:MAG: glycosyltransferase family 4 protein, partial [Phycisphaerae bacterium]
RHQVLRRYGVPGDRVHVVYNACRLPASASAPKPAIDPQCEKTVLFLGRVTGQKGPEFFLAAAEKVLAETQSVRFIVGGAGEGVESAVALAARKGIGHRVLFTGFLRSGDIERVFRLADLFVMPSQSEPFGLAALEAAGSGVPVILTRQSGAAEVLTHALKVDYGDVDGLKAAILRVLHDSALAQRLREGAWSDVARLTWEASAGQCLDIYHGLCGHLVTGQR